MSNWKLLCRSIDVGPLVPDAFVGYRGPIADALTFFLERLSPPRQSEILADQLMLPADAPVQVRLVAIARRSPILHKIGQLLARDRRLPADLRQLLQGLESAEPTIGAAEARVLIQKELGDLDRLGISIDEEPLAEASMAVVIPFARHESGRTERGVLKLLKPNIEQRLDEELAILDQVGEFLDSQCQRYGIPEIDYADLFAQVRQLLDNEVDLTSERSHMESARDVYADWPKVIVPKLFPFFTSRLIAMERVEGHKVTDLSSRSPVDRRRIASRMIDSLIACPVWSEREHAIFHADPHAGNLLVTDDRRLVILDWGLAGTLSKQNRIAVTQILIGALTLDQRAIIAAISDLAEGRLNDRELTAVVSDAVRRVRRGTFPSLAWLTSLLDDAVTRAGVSFAGDLLLFRKSLLILDGVVHDVSEDFSTSTALAASLTMRLGSDWRSRILTSPMTRASSTHLSNIDLWRLLSSGPGTSVRFWRGLAQDWFDGSAKSKRIAID
jgi:ubiquinone biosynthesis protein